MDVKKLVLLLGAVLLAGVSAFMAKSIFGDSGTQPVTAAVMPAEPKGLEILVATKPLPVGTIIDAESFRYQPWPKDLVKDVYYERGKEEPKDLAGRVVRIALTAGQPVTKGALVAPGDRGFLAAALGAGMRAITVPVNANSGVAGFIFPGDRVDLVVTQDVPGGGDGPPLKVSETVITNLRVLATDQRTDKVVNEEGQATAVVFSNVTLEATPRIAEQIAVAQRVGELSLTLRSIADNATELEAAIASGDISIPKGADAATEKAILTAAAQRPSSASRSSFTTGADVSRFQRRTVPAKPVSQASGPAGSAGSAEVPKGPLVRVARGNTLTEVPIGGK